MTNLARLEPMLVEFEKLNREHIVAMVHGDPLAPDLEFRRQARAGTEQIHTAVGHMIIEENKLLAQRQQSSQHAARVVTRVNIVACLVSVALIVTVFGALSRENVRRRASEEELQRSRDHLELRVQQRTRSLVRSEAE